MPAFNIFDTSSKPLISWCVFWTLKKKTNNEHDLDEFEPILRYKSILEFTQNDAQ